MTILLILLIIDCIGIILISILMAPDSSNMSGALVGSADIDLFVVKKSRGMKKWLIRIMAVLGIVLIITSVVIKLVM